MKLVLLLAVLAIAAPAFAVYTSQCDLEYEQCMRNCCSNCDATLGWENDRPVCWFWATKNLDQGCMSTCTYCESDYRTCKGLPPLNQGGTGGNNSSNPGTWANQTVLGNGTGNTSQKGDWVEPSFDLKSELCGSGFVLLGALAVAFARRSEN